MKQFPSLFFFVCLLSFFYIGCKPGEIELRLKPQHHSRYRMVFNTVGKVSMNMAGKDLGTDINTSIATQLTIDSLENNKYGFELIYDDYDMAQTVEGKKISMKDLPADSAGNASNVMNLVKGLTFKTVMSAQGKAAELSGGDTLVQRMKDAMKDMPEETRNMLLTALRPVINSDMARGMLEQCFFVFPAEKVNVGDSWKNEIVMQSMFSMIIRSTYTLVEIKEGIAQLKVHADIKPGNPDVIMPGLAMAAPKGSDPSPQEAGLDLMGMKMKATFNGTQDGTVWVDMSNGMVKKNSLAQDLTGKISISILDLPMTMKMQTSYEVTPVQ